MWYFVGGALLLVSSWALLRKGKLMAALKMIEMIRSVSHEPLPAQHVAGNVYVVTYLHNGQQYKLFFPIQSDVKNQFFGKDVYVSIGETSVNINQEPGVPYLIRAGDFDGEAQVSVYCEDDETNKIFKDAQPIDNSS